MRLLKLNEIPEGTPLGQSIFDERGLLLLGERYPLRQFELNKIRDLGYEYLYVDTPESEKITIVPPLSPKVDALMRRTITEQFDRIGNWVSTQTWTSEKLKRLTTNFDEIKSVVDVGQVNSAAQYMLDDLEAQNMAPLDTYLMKGKTTYLRDHSLNVAVMSVLLGNRFGFRHADLQELTIGALLHCCGLLYMPALIGRDERTLSDVEWYSYRQYPDLSQATVTASTDRYFRARLAIEQHRERQDGRGFPRGLRGTNLRPEFTPQAIDGNHIFPMAEVIAVAKAFDEYVGRGFGMPMSPEEAALNIIARSKHDLNVGIVESWLNLCSLFPPGVTVKIIRCPDPTWKSAVGLVQQTNWSDPHRPKLIMLKTASGENAHEAEVDLAQFERCMIRMVI